MDRSTQWTNDTGSDGQTDIQQTNYASQFRFNQPIVHPVKTLICVQVAVGSTAHITSALRTLESAKRQLPTSTRTHCFQPSNHSVSNKCCASFHYFKDKSYVVSVWTCSTKCHLATNGTRTDRRWKSKMWPPRWLSCKNSLWSSLAVMMLLQRSSCLLTFTSSSVFLLM